MATIFYSLCGEGRGHATRVHAIVERLRMQHRVVIFAPEQAHDYFTANRMEGVEVRRVAGLRFQYDRFNRVHIRRTGSAFMRYLFGFPRIIRGLARQIERDAPDLIVTDLEPALPRAAERVGVPFVACDHQSVFGVTDPRAFPVDVRGHALFIASFVRAHYTSQEHTISSSFYFPESKVRDNVTRVGSILRDTVIQHETCDDGHLLVYARRGVSTSLRRALRQVDIPVKLYGMGKRSRDRNIEYRNTNVDGFIDDLSSAHAVVSSAGNQLLSEATYFGKPVMALPEVGQHEQKMNAWLLEHAQVGVSAEDIKVSRDDLVAFLDNHSKFKEGLRNIPPPGVEDVVTTINRRLQAHGVGMVA